MFDNEPEDEPKACPKCGGDKIEIDAGPMVTSMKGVDYQDIWVGCFDCGFSHHIDVVDYPTEKYPTQLCIRQWNDLYRNYSDFW